MEFDEIVQLSVKHNAADLHLCSGHRPRWRRGGILELIENQPSTGAGELEQLASLWLNSVQNGLLVHQGQVDLAITTPSGIRLRVNFFQQRYGLSLAVRRIPETVPRSGAASGSGDCAAINT